MNKKIAALAARLLAMVLLSCAPFGVQAAVSKLSQIVDGSTYVYTTDKLVTVRNGNTDVLTAINVIVANGQDFGMHCDGNVLYDMTLTNSSSTVSSASHTFVAGDVGKHINVSATNMKSAANVTTTIASVSAGNAVLSAPWTSTTVTGVGVAVMYTTDDTTAFNTALSTLHTRYPNGSELQLSGYCVVGAATLYRQQLISCANGYQSCELVAKPGTNANWITSENQATLTGTGANYGTDADVPSFFGLEDIHLNGNAPAQSSGDCVDFYGNAEIMKGNVLIESCWGNGLHTEAANVFPYNSNDWRAQEEGFFDHLTVRNYGTYGWLDQGPHDKIVLDFLAFAGNSTGYVSQTSGALYTGSAHAEKLHVYDTGDDTGFNLGATLTAQEVYSDFANTTINAGGTTIDHLFYTACGNGGLGCLIIPSGVFYWHIGQLDVQMLDTAANLAVVDIQSGGGNGVIDSYQMSPVTPGANVTAFKIRSPFITLGDGVISNFQTAGDICFDLDGATFVDIRGTGFGCTTFFNFGSGDNNNNINFQAYTGGTGTGVISGTPGTLDILGIVNDIGTSNIKYPSMVIGSPTGGNEGAGSINATTIFKNGVPVSTSTGTVTSVDVSGGTTGITTTGGPVTGSGTVTLVVPSATSSASTVVARDTNQNSFANNFTNKATNVVSSGGVTTLTVASAHIQNLSGTQNHSFKMPNATTLAVGYEYYFNNSSTGLLMITDSSPSSICDAVSGATKYVELIDASTSAGTWVCRNMIPDMVQWSTNGLYILSNAFWTNFVSNGNSGTSIALNLDNGPNQTLTINGAVTITQTTPTHPGCYKVFLKQDNVGHAITFSGVLWPGGAPTFSSAANAIDEASICYDGTNYYGNASIHFQ